MNDQRPSRASSLIVVAVVFLLLIAYAAVYFQLSTVESAWGQDGKVFTARVFSSRWQALFFNPAAALESFLSGKQIETIYRVPKHRDMSFDYPTKPIFAPDESKGKK